MGDGVRVRPPLRDEVIHGQVVGRVLTIEGLRPHDTLAVLLLLGVVTLLLLRFRKRVLARRRKAE